MGGWKEWRVYVCLVAEIIAPFFVLFFVLCSLFLFRIFCVCAFLICVFCFLRKEKKNLSVILGKKEKLTMWHHHSFFKNKKNVHKSKKKMSLRKNVKRKKKKKEFFFHTNQIRTRKKEKKKKKVIKTEKNKISFYKKQKIIYFVFLFLFLFNPFVHTSFFLKKRRKVSLS